MLYCPGVNRRHFLLTSLTGAIAAPRVVAAQRAGGVRRIAYLGNAPTTPVTDSFWDAFVAGLQEHGWVQPRSIVIERRYLELGMEPAIAAVEELSRIGVEVIVVSSTQVALAAKQATRTLPIVMTIPSDPVAVGLVASLARPGGNVTGLSFVGTEVAGKQVDLLREAVKGLASIAVLANPMNPCHPPRVKTVLATARTLKLRVDVAEVSTRDEISEALRAIGKRGTGAALVLADPLFVREASSIIQLAADQRLPVMYGLREAAVAGGFMSYGPSFTEQFRRAAAYVDKILKGAKPADLPIEQPTKFELVVNVKAAKALGLTVPPSLLLRADQVIE
jgi:putative ABC transport system substrate-binding protein